MFEGLSSTSTLMVVVAILLITWMYFNIRRPPGMPPGPMPYPIIGNVPSNVITPYIYYLRLDGELPQNTWPRSAVPLLLGKKQPSEVFMDMVTKYGPLISFKFGSNWAVVINNYELTQEALLTKLNDFSGRPTQYLADYFSDNQKDIAFTQPTTTWKFHRKLAHTAIRKYATGDLLENLILDVQPKIRKVIEEKGGKPFNPKEVITLAIYNVIASMCFGHKYQFNDLTLVRYIKLSEDLNEAFGNGTLADFIPAARFLPSPQVTKIKKGIEELFFMTLKEVSQHLESYSPDETPNDLIDLLLQAQAEEKSSDDDGTNMLTDIHLKQIVLDLFVAGTDTTTTSLLWALACLIDNPDIQEKINQEIDDVIGDRPPRLSDRGKLPYTEASIMEIMRYGTVTPLGLTHRALKDSSIGNFKIPEDTWVFINHWALHNDPKYWDSPEKFKPERFLDASNSVKMRLPSFLPFSTGRRVCVGETLAKAEIFLLLTWLIHNYKFSKAPGITEKVAVSGAPKSVNFTKMYQTVANLRT